jgi:GrpB-like predicted nucleotidyltransferase (UPF0157 family)
MSNDKDPARLQGIDALAHRAFRSFTALHGAVSSVQLDEPITLHAADPQWPRLFEAEAERLRRALPVDLAPDMEHIGSTAVPGLDAKPVVDVMIGVKAPERIGDLVALLEGLGYESLGEAGVPGRWALRRRNSAPAYNISVVAHEGHRWRQNLCVRDLLRTDPEAAPRYAAAKWQAIESGALTLFAYSDAKRSFIEALAARCVPCAEIKKNAPKLDR